MNIVTGCENNGLNWCDKSQNTVSTVHEGKKKFLCDISNAGFQRKRGLAEHIASIHEGKKLFKCDICALDFAYNTNLKQYISQLHKMEKKFKCNIYDTSYGLKASRDSHVARVHEGKNPINAISVNLNGFAQKVN